MKKAFPLRTTYRPPQVGARFCRIKQTIAYQNAHNLSTEIFPLKI
jgi:hypothetical protein